MVTQQTPNQPTSETEEEQKLRHELEEEKLKNQIHKLRASSVEIWVKEIKSIVLLAVFVLGTATNGILYLLELLGKKVPKEALRHHVHNAMASAGAGSGGGGTGGEQVAMAMAQPSGFDLTALINSMGGTHTLWQILLFAILIPIGLDWLKKQKIKKQEEKNASTSIKSDEDKHQDSVIK